ncbi:hypothetical protein D9M71_163720 [compost metagenome]
MAIDQVCRHGDTGNDQAHGVHQQRTAEPEHGLAGQPQAGEQRAAQYLAQHQRALPEQAGNAADRTQCAAEASQPGDQGREAPGLPVPLENAPFAGDAQNPCLKCRKGADRQVHAVGQPEERHTPDQQPANQADHTLDQRRVLFGPSGESVDNWNGAFEQLIHSG